MHYTVTNVNGEDRLSVENSGAPHAAQRRTQALDVRTDLWTDPWTDLRGGGYRFGEVVRVGVVPDGYGPGWHGLALLTRCQDGSMTVSEVSMHSARIVAEMLSHIGDD